MLAILAVEQDDKIDARIECIAKEVQKVDPKQTGFQLHKIVIKLVAVGGWLEFEVLPGQSVSIAVKQDYDSAKPIQVNIKPPLLGEITYETCCGKFLPIVTRYRTADDRTFGHRASA